MSKTKPQYDDGSIAVLKGIEGVRQNPSMYVGDDGIRGLHHILYEVIDNSIDEFMAGFCNEISLTIEKDGSITIEDNGRGLPVGIHPEEKKPTIEVILTTLHAGGKFDNYIYKISGGLHGVGVSCTNALSEWLNISVYRNSKTHTMSFERGHVTVGFKKQKGVASKTLKGDSGTLIHFKPDSEIFSTTKVDAETIKNKLKELSYLNAGLKVVFENKRKGDVKEVMLNKDGIKAYIREIIKNKKPLYTTPFYLSTDCDQKTYPNTMVNITLQHGNQDNDLIYSFANNIKTVDGGTHVSGLRKALTRVVNQFAIDNDKLSKDCERLDGIDVRNGVSAIISVYLPEPKFEGQTKGKLTNTEMEGAVSSVFSDAFRTWLDEHSTVADKIIKKAVISHEARVAAKKAASIVKKKAALDINDLPGKLKNCRSKNPKEKELFIVEGVSAGGNAEMARNSEFQAILPLKGKTINVENKPLDVILKNEEIGSLIKAIGTGISENGEEEEGFDLDKLNFHKIIIATDADVDGSHIRALLLNFFFRYMKPLLQKGHIWLAKPPLYRVALTKAITWRHQNSKNIFINTDEELEVFMKKHNKIMRKDGIQRFKGLGELNASQLKETTMEKGTREVIQVGVSDLDEADNLFSVLFGKDVNARYDYIKEHSDIVKNLDI